MSTEHGSKWRSEHDRSAQRADAPPGARSRTAGGSLPPDGGGGRGVGARIGKSAKKSRHTKKPPEEPHYVVTVEQWGEREDEYFIRFSEMVGQWYNYGLCRCTVIEVRCCGIEPLSAYELSELEDSMEDGRNHWSNRI